MIYDIAITSAVSAPADSNALIAMANAIERLRITVPYTNAMASLRSKNTFPTTVLNK